MAKSARDSAAPSQPLKGRWRVAVKGYPVVGFEDVGKDGKKTIHSSLPAAPHYRRRAEDLDHDVPEGWHTERDIVEFYGLPEVPKNFRKRTRIRTDLTATLFKGAVVPADTEYEAKDVFARDYGINETKRDNWIVVEKVSGDTPLGPYGPLKDRGLLKRTG